MGYFVTDSGEKRHLGRIKPKSRPQCLRLQSYLDLSEVSVPESVDYTKGADDVVKQMYMNNQYGCCVISSAYHVHGTSTVADGQPPLIGKDNEVYQMYQTICGRGDNGCNIAEVLNYRKSKGLPFNGVIHKIDGYIAVDWTNKVEAQVAIFLFGNLTLGVDLPSAWANTDNGEDWDVTNSGIVGGHDIPCFSADTKVSLLNGLELTMKELADGKAGDSFYVYSCDENGNVVPGLAHSARKTGTNRKMVSVTLDNGEVVRCTNDHRWMLRDGTYREAKDLKPQDSLMPLYRQSSTKKGMKGYEKIYNPSTNSWRYTHRTVMKDKVQEWYKGDVVHHKDFNKLNNSPDNLELMSWAEHTKLHNENTELLQQYAKSEEGRAKSRELMNKLWADPEWAEKQKDKLRSNSKQFGFATITDEQRKLVHKKSKEARKNKANRLKNHKVISIEDAGYEDVYDFTVEKHHNFALSAGTFVHNCVGYNTKGVKILTWGGWRTITWAAFTSKKWLSECYCSLLPDWYGTDNVNKATGFDVVKLKGDLEKLGNGTIPDITPPTPPPPLPPGPPAPAPNGAYPVRVQMSDNSLYDCVPALPAPPE